MPEQRPPNLTPPDTATRRPPLPEEVGTVPASFGGYLAGLRRERGLSLREAAAMLGLSNGYLSLLETGARLPRPSVTLAQRIAVAFHRPTEEALAAQGLRAETTADRTTLIDRAFRRLVLDPELMPAGMDARHWLDAFSTRQKLQILELAQNVFAWARLADDEHADPEDAEVFDILQRFPTEAAR